MGQYLKLFNATWSSYFIVNNVNINLECRVNNKRDVHVGEKNVHVVKKEQNTY